MAKQYISKELCKNPQGRAMLLFSFKVDFNLFLEKKGFVMSDTSLLVVGLIITTRRYIYGVVTEAQQTF